MSDKIDDVGPAFAHGGNDACPRQEGRSPAAWELVDASDEEVYHTIGMFPTREDAEAEVERAGDDVSVLGVDTDFDEHAKVELRRRPFGLSGAGIPVKSWEWEQRCADDDYCWFLKAGAR